MTAASLFYDTTKVNVNVVVYGNSVTYLKTNLKPLIAVVKKLKKSHRVHDDVIKAIQNSCDAIINHFYSLVEREKNYARFK